MRKSIMLTLFILMNLCLVLSQKSQSYSVPNFKEFLSLFPEINLPFYALWDFEKRTSFELPLKQISSDLAETFICQEGIKCNSDYCSSDKVFGFSAIGRFKYSKNFYTLLLTFDADAGCEEKWYLITYSLDGELIDKIIVYGKTYLKLPSKDNSNRTQLRTESNLEIGKIAIDYLENEFKQNKESVSTYSSLYKINSDGQFIKTE